MNSVRCAERVLAMPMSNQIQNKKKKPSEVFGGGEQPATVAGISGPAPSLLS